MRVLGEALHGDFQVGAAQAAAVHSLVDLFDIANVLLGKLVVSIEPRVQLLQSFDGGSAVADLGDVAIDAGDEILEACYGEGTQAFVAVHAEFIQQGEKEWIVDSGHHLD